MINSDVGAQDHTGPARRDRIERLGLSAVMLVVGAAAAFASYGYGLTSERGGIGPGAVPFVASLIILVEGLVLGRSRDGQKTDSTEGSQTPGGDSLVNTASLSLSLILLAMLSVVLLLTPVVGFIPMIVAFGFVVGRFLEGATVLASIILGLASGLFIWAVFIALLGVRLPTFFPSIF